jgi:hypothetical protein
LRNDIINQNIKTKENGGFRPNTVMHCVNNRSTWYYVILEDYKVYFTGKLYILDYKYNI